MTRTRSRVKHVTYTLNVTCNKTPEMNERDFLEQVRIVLDQGGINLDGTRPRVSVIRRVEEYLPTAKEQP